MDWAVLDADQMAGGVLIMWDRRVLEKLEVLVGSFSMSVNGKGWRMVLFGHVQGCMAQMTTI